MLDRDFTDEFGDGGYWDKIATFPFQEGCDFSEADICMGVERARRIATLFYISKQAIRAEFTDLVEEPDKYFWLPPGVAYEVASSSLIRLASPSCKVVATLAQAPFENGKCGIFFTAYNGGPWLNKREGEERIRTDTFIEIARVFLGYAVGASEFFSDLSIEQWDVAIFALYLRQRLITGKGEPGKSYMKFCVSASTQEPAE